MRVGQASSDADLAQEAIGSQHRGDLRTQDLDGNLSIMLALDREIHGRHAALTELSVDFIARRQGVAHHVELARHSPPCTRSGQWRSAFNELECAPGLR